MVRRKDHSSFHEYGVVTAFSRGERRKIEHSREYYDLR
ncbi:hypothetical protein B4113_2884 [Geobacillus sp. B4113_201601]|nr:hypothetical protein B4113_2884 [Geobacillus sp. B4113_201601]